MKKQLNLIVILVLLSSLVALGCDTEDTLDRSSDGSDPPGTDTNNNNPPAVCNINVLETFDTGIPQGWTVIGGGSGSGSGSNSASEAVVDPLKTWHHTTVEAETAAQTLPTTTTQPGIENLAGGIMMVGNVMGQPMREVLQTPYFNIGSCTSATLNFKSSFQTLLEDRGEVLINLDGPTGTVVTTIPDGYSANPIDLSAHLPGYAAFQLQFVFHDENQMSLPWFIDDVSVVGAE